MTTAQDAARTRNWRIRGLRALYELCRTLSPENRVIAQGAIDAELKAAGAASGAEHYAKVAAEWERRADRENLLDGEDMDLPF